MRLIALAVIASNLFLTVPASAAGLNYTAGIINRDGSINSGSGFTVTHDGTGKYTITFAAGVFPTHSPAMTCTPFGKDGGFPICFVLGESWNGSVAPTTFGIRLLDLAGALQDNGFQFTEVTVR
jgi:hypothetical protein